ncbi:hypothetical protein V8F33_006323 [Rhypophila sp. PSN 637]
MAFSALATAMAAAGVLLLWAPHPFHDRFDDGKVLVLNSNDVKYWHDFGCEYDCPRGFPGEPDDAYEGRIKIHVNKTYSHTGNLLLKDMSGQQSSFFSLRSPPHHLFQSLQHSTPERSTVPSTQTVSATNLATGAAASRDVLACLRLKGKNVFACRTDTTLGPAVVLLGAGVVAEGSTRLICIAFDPS